MSYYPLFLNLENRRCLVIGGGPVAERKVNGLLEAGAKVTVVSRTLTGQLASRVNAEKIYCLSREYQPGDLAGFQLAFVATDEPSVNTAVKREGEERGVWVNVADDPIHCDFILPSILRRGGLTVAVATGGLSPALSKAIREELELYFTEDYAILSEVVAEVRQDLRGRGLSAGPEVWSRALNGSLRNFIRQRDIEGAKRYLRDQVGA